MKKVLESRLRYGAWIFLLCSANTGFADDTLPSTSSNSFQDDTFYKNNRNVFLDYNNGKITREEFSRITGFKGTIPPPLYGRNSHPSRAPRASGRRLQNSNNPERVIQPTVGPQMYKTVNQLMTVWNGHGYVTGWYAVNVPITQSELTKMYDDANTPLEQRYPNAPGMAQDVPGHPDMRRVVISVDGTVENHQNTKEKKTIVYQNQINVGTAQNPEWVNAGESTVEDDRESGSHDVRRYGDSVR